MDPGAYKGCAANDGEFNRFAYAGACKDPALVLEATGCADPKATNYAPKLPKASNDPRLCQGMTGLASLDP